MLNSDPAYKPGRFIVVFMDSNDTQQRLTPFLERAGNTFKTPKVFFSSESGQSNLPEEHRQQHLTAEALLIAAISGSLGNSSFTLSEDHSS